MRLLVLGFGTVGRALAEILPNGFELSVCSSKGGVQKIERRLLAVLAVKAGKLDELPDFIQMNPLEAVQEWDFDALVDLSPTNLENAEPSTTYWTTAFERGKSVVSANKGPLAFQYGKLNSLAEENKTRLLFEATVAGGTPVFSMARHCLQGAGLLRVEGILNGTTNYILTRMQSGQSFGEALMEAQEKGYAERDPRNDVEGKDALAKAVILANALFGQDAAFKDFTSDGITRLTKDDVLDAKKENHCFKLIAQVNSESLDVKLKKLPFTHPLANIGDAWNALTFYTKSADAITISGRGAGGMPTASSVLNDLLELRASAAK